jgi:uncharacterized protein YabE (DUF348 family)
MDNKTFYKHIADLCVVVDDYEYDRKIVDENIYKEKREELVKIGIDANIQGGSASMLSLVENVSCFYSNTGNTLNSVWNNIGAWKN